jgi:NAD(P)-dependent dehydrogenase (short-subunit alcohol dehydrogenase family)
MGASMGLLEGKVGIVTGSGSGIGRATAIRMAQEGAAVVVADINPAGARDTVEAISRAGGKAIAHETDIASEQSVKSMVTAAVDQFGRLDLLHNNAANVFVVPNDLDVITTDLETWDATFATNVRGTFLCCKHVLPHLLEGGGAIVNMSSNAGQMGDLLRVAYGVSKAGVESLTRYVATMYGKQGVRCNAISPGVVATPALVANVSEVELAMFADHHLTPYIAEPADIAAVVVFLMSDQARFITGQVVNVDGGMLAHTPLFQQMRAAGAG